MRDVLDRARDWFAVSRTSALACPLTLIADLYNELRQLRDETQAYAANARVELARVRSTVHDGLTGKNDLLLKVSLLQDVDAVDEILRKVLR